ncbi:ABC transporter permease [Niveispirillum cyanobacteriorum]|uniref:Peptide ABC transporter permease n=1 Tax=Niveispirillum cyanobacteriorum TaxID=1612173 RepID=A0A2K9NDD5_9PROT|nr:ABC transporter permease [Niveispirillum cyanobacteriorum]AUN31114.1 peptide ABC transporter permease [Niveispirillum cyanobacteriorum]GGE84675.1 membrane protein [Niveispirillum cyanobacteriorum]
MRILNQIIAVCSINLKSLPERFWLSFSTVMAVAMVVTVLLSFLALAAGFKRTLDGTGSEGIAIMLRDGSQQEVNSVIALDQLRLIGEAPGIVRKDDGNPLVSGELYVIVDGVRRSTGLKANLPLRGIGKDGAALRDGLTITQGRMFEPGSNEIVVGEGLIREFAGFDLGSEVRLGTGTWKVVGVFSMNGAVFESELWGDATVVQSLFRRGSAFQTVRVRLQTPESIDLLRDYVANEPRLKLEVFSEKGYFAGQSSNTVNLIKTAGWPLAIAMALGALAGALNTMYSSVASRSREIATLRCLGFGGFPSFVATLLESLVLAGIGGVIGSLGIFLFFDGFSTSTLGQGFTQIVFTVTLTPALVQQGIILALIVGLIGGFFPALRAARVPIVTAYSQG